MVFDHRVVANGDVSPDHAEVTDADVFAQLGSWIHNSGLSDECTHGCSVILMFAFRSWMLMVEQFGGDVNPLFGAD